jgi:hypothetical protein
MAMGTRGPGESGADFVPMGLLVGKSFVAKGFAGSGPILLNLDPLPSGFVSITIPRHVPLVTPG